jgi:ribosomal protein S18 acetylase RimI-like enzyme
MMPDGFNGFDIAKYQEQDFESVAELFRNVYVQTYSNFDERFHRVERFQAILRENTIPNSKIWTAKYKGEIVGFVAIAENCVDQLYILENFQGKGLGSFWIDEAKSIYPDFLELYTFDCNGKAIEFYEKHGFEIIEKGIALDEKMLDVKMRWEVS